MRAVLLPLLVLAAGCHLLLPLDGNDTPPDGTPPDSRPPVAESGPDAAGDSLPSPPHEAGAPDNGPLTPDATPDSALPKNDMGGATGNWKALPANVSWTGDAAVWIEPAGKIYIAADNKLYSCTDTGAALQCNNTLSAPTGVVLHDLFGVGGGEVFVFGDNSAALSNQSKKVTKFLPGGPYEFFGAWCTSSACWLAGSGSQPQPAAGIGSFDPAVMSGIYVNSLTGIGSTAFHDIWVSASGKAVAVGTDCDTYLFDTVTEQPTTTPGSPAGCTGTLRSVFGLADNLVYAGGDNGIIYKWDGSIWQTRAVLGAPIRALWAHNGKLFVVGDGVVDVVNTATGVNNISNPTGLKPSGLWGVDEFLVYAVGPGGQVVRYQAP